MKDAEELAAMFAAMIANPNGATLANAFADKLRESGLGSLASHMENAVRMSRGKPLQVFVVVHPTEDEFGYPAVKIPAVYTDAATAAKHAELSPELEVQEQFVDGTAALIASGMEPYEVQLVVGQNPVVYEYTTAPVDSIGEGSRRHYHVRLWAKNRTDAIREARKRRARFRQYMAAVSATE